MKQTIPDFIPYKFGAEYGNAAAKNKFASHFIRFVESGFKRSLFTKSFYNRLSMCRGHIAHYDINGFYDTWFATPETKAKFIQHWITSPIYGDPEYTYCDVEKFLSKWLASKA